MKILEDAKPGEVFVVTKGHSGELIAIRGQMEYMYIDSANPMPFGGPDFHSYASAVYVITLKIVSESEGINDFQAATRKPMQITDAKRIENNRIM